MVEVREEMPLKKDDIQSRRNLCRSVLCVCQREEQGDMNITAEL